VPSWRRSLCSPQSCHYLNSCPNWPKQALLVCIAARVTSLISISCRRVKWLLTVPRAPLPTWTAFLFVFTIVLSNRKNYYAIACFRLNIPSVGKTLGTNHLAAYGLCSTIINYSALIVIYLIGGVRFSSTLFVRPSAHPFVSFRRNFHRRAPQKLEST